MFIHQWLSLSFYFCLASQLIFDRVNIRMRQLSCDTGVWKNVFKKIWEVIQVKDTERFNEGTLKRMVEFCTQAKVGPEMRSEVVKVAAGMIQFPDPQGPEIKIRLAIQSWGSPQTL